MKSCLCSLVFTLTILFYQLSYSQSYPLGLTPSSLKWKQIDNEEMEVVFPEGVEAQAQRVANLIRYLKNNNLESIGNKTDKVTIILQNQTITPNGFVALSPFRSELFLTPPQFNFLGAGDWLDLLTIHEYRHVLQTTNAKRGFTGFGSFLLGENTLAFLRRMALPRWYLEGDAVGVETALTHSGRGRMPHFDMEYKAMRLSGFQHNYEKASAFSLKDYVPDHYNLGYYMTTWGRKNFGEDIWKKTIGEAVKYKNFFPLSSALRKYTGHRTPSMYKTVMASLDSTWQAQDSQLKPNEYNTITTATQKKYTNYRNPQYLDNNSWIVEKSSFDQIRTYYRVYRNGKEEKLFAPGFNYSFNNTLSVNNGKVVWTEVRFDPRWGSQDFSIIRSGNLNGSNKSKLTSESKYFVPTFSSDGKKIVVVKSTTAQEYSLVILNATDGSVMKELPNPDNHFYSFPRFTEDDKHIVVVAQKNQQHALMQIDVDSGEAQYLTEPNFEQLSNPFPKNGKVYFSSTYTGINNIFAIDKQSGNITQLTNSRFGAFQPAVSPDGKNLIYSDYTAMGYELREISLGKPLLTLADNKLPDNNITFYKTLEEQEGGSILENVSNETFETKKFNKLSGFINPHSLQAFPLHPEYSVEVQLENKFQTVSGAVGYTFNVNENTGGLYADFTYGQFFPVLEAGVRFNNDRSRLGHAAISFVRNDTLFSASEPNAFGKSWKEDNVYAGVTIPLNLTHGNYISSLRLSGYYNFYNVTYDNILDSEGDVLINLDNQDGPVNAMEFRLRFNRSKITALQHLNTRFGQIIDIRYRSTFITNRNQGDVLTVSSNFFFPGLFRTHSIQADIAYQNEGRNESYQFRDNFFYPRGYQSIPHDEIYRYSFNYALPIAYPDVAAGPFAFLQRIKLNGFFDLGWVNNKSRAFSEFEYLLGNGDKSMLFFPERGTSYKSFGAELTFDLRLFRLLDANLGVRYSYLMDVDKTLDPGRNANQIDFILLSIGG